MEVNVQTLSDVSREVEIVATPDDLREHFERAYQEYRKKIEIRGFRKGKAPLDLVKKLYGDMIEQDSLQDVASALFRQAVKSNHLNPIGEPTLVDMDYKRSAKFTCKIKYDVRPTIELREYKGISVEKPVHTVTEDEIEQELTRLRRINSTFEPAETVSGQEFVVTANLQDLDETGMPLIGKKTENVRFYLADEQLEQPFKDALGSVSAGQQVRVQFEHQHGEHAHAVNAQITVTKVERVLLPELDDAFVARITKDKMKTVAALRDGIRKDVAAYWKTRSERQVLNALTAEIIRRHDFQVPESVVRSVLDGLLDDMRQEYPNKRLPDEFNVEKFREENRAYAIYQAKWALLRAEIIKAENLQAEDADFERLATEESARLKIDKERLIKYYKNSEQIKDRVVGDKLIKLLVDSAKIKEVPEQSERD